MVSNSRHRKFYKMQVCKKSRREMDIQKIGHKKQETAKACVESTRSYERAYL